ncbi:hypothetical protein ACJ73_10168, partial [Blastomyces percursus]
MALDRIEFVYGGCTGKPDTCNLRSRRRQRQPHAVYRRLSVRENTGEPVTASRIENRLSRVRRLPAAAAAAGIKPVQRSAVSQSIRGFASTTTIIIIMKAAPPQHHPQRPLHPISHPSSPPPLPPPPPPPSSSSSPPHPSS